MIPAEKWLSHVRETAEGFDVFGELGRTTDADLWFLARDQSTQGLVALRLRQAGEGGAEAAWTLEVAQQLDGQVAMGLGECRRCGAKLRSYARFCGKCGVDLTGGLEVATSPTERQALLRQVREAASEVYDVLGEMPWAAGAGIVYFALEKATARLVRLRLRAENEAFALGETEALMPLEDRRVAAGYTTEVVPKSPVPMGETTNAGALPGRPPWRWIVVAAAVTVLLVVWLAFR